MTVLDSFVSFANSLSADRLQSVEAALAALMESYADTYGFTPAEMQEIERRVAEPAPQYASPAAITQLFGKPFGS
ncbi:MAG: hypothetical protein KGL44_08255 [Sphingomonadales bacterium]|nr:hypothetical protein [Sphingomonadales bacterium]